MNFEKNKNENFNRLKQTPYLLSEVFQPQDYTWYGDWEGRALLAFCCHYEIDGGVIPCMHDMVASLPQKTNGKGFFGPISNGEKAREQQLSGHNWYLRGLLKYARLFNSDYAMSLAKSTVENLYLPIKDFYDKYPLDRGDFSGGVSGNEECEKNGWVLSTDVGCAFMCVDGLAHYYLVTKDEKVKEFLDKAIDLFLSIDLLKYKFQTHTSLTCLRGILVLYKATGEQKNLDAVKEKFNFYLENGMTETYENFNWFGREDTWTEPCAVVDSFILAGELFNVTLNPEYRKLASRIWLNGLQFCQRENGGAGPNSCVTKTQPLLKISMYEAPFCCTMRYAEGLAYYSANLGLVEEGEGVYKEGNKYFCGNSLLVEDLNGNIGGKDYQIDGKKLKKLCDLGFPSQSPLLKVIF